MHELCHECSLYNVYSDKKIVKGFMGITRPKYKIDDAEAKKFIVGRFLDYKILDSKVVVGHVILVTPKKNGGK